MRISRKILFSTILVVSLSAAGAAVASAQDDGATAETTASVPGILPAFITAGAPDPAGKIPNINAVPGAAVDNLDVALPATVLAHGSEYVYTVALQSTTYSGKYTVGYRLTQVVRGKTEVLESGTIISDTKTEPLDYWIWVKLSKPIADSPGPATLEAVITYGKETVTTSTQVLIK